jgi:hypothetical protein
MTTKTDRELLEMAAKAGGVKGRRYVENQAIQGKYRTGFWCDLLEDIWNPLTDDGDALRLAVDLHLNVWVGRGGTGVNDGEIPTRNQLRSIEPHNDDPYAATRRAIVRAAAEIGKDMK